jgi:hypothetical protein
MNPGNKVLCIKRGMWMGEEYEPDLTYPRFGMELTIRAVNEEGGLQFEEIINPIKMYIGGTVEVSFASSRFRKLEHHVLKISETTSTDVPSPSIIDEDWW